MRAERERILPIRQGLLERPRIHKLLEEGITYPIVKVTAPPGYGKSHEVALFLRDANVRLGWIRLTRLDNLPSHFWANVVGSVAREFPELAEKLEALGYPESLGDVEQCLHMLAESVYNGKQAVFVLDNFGALEHEEVLNFMRLLATAWVENMTLVLIGRYEVDVGMPPEVCWSIGTEHLRFTVEELKEHYEQYGIHLDEPTARRLYRETDGWPLAVDLLSMQLVPGLEPVGQGVDIHVIHRLFEQECFAGYDRELRVLLVKLSLLPNFPKALLGRVGGCDPDKAEQMLIGNMFTTYDAKRKLFYFQNMYRDFLAEKQVLIEDEAICQVYAVAGDCALEQGMLVDAIDHYSLGRRYQDMLETMVRFLGTSKVLILEHVQYLMDKLDNLPGEVQQTHLAKYARVELHILRMETRQAAEIIRHMEADLLMESSETADAMLGEIYERMAVILMYEGNEDFMEYYKLAAHYLPEGSSYKPRNLVRYCNQSIFSIQNDSPGAIERMEAVLYGGMEYFLQVENQGAVGFDFLYSTEAAYCTLHYKRAKEMAEKTIAVAEAAGQVDILCNGWFMLAKTSAMRGNYDTMVACVRTIEQCSKGTHQRDMQPMVEYANHWLKFQLGVLEDMAPWTESTDFGLAAAVPKTLRREEILYARYLFSKKRYGEMVAFLERLLLRVSKGWIHRVEGRVLLALGYFKLRDQEKAVECFQQAYDMTHQNNILSPFVEAGSDMRTFIDNLRQGGYTQFDAEWLSTVYRKSTTCAKHLSTMQKNHQKDLLGDEEPRVSLTRRELNVLANLAQGLTREEIALQSGVTVNTVKSTINSIYNKLGAVNRADAMRIAIAKELIH